MRPGARFEPDLRPPWEAPPVAQEEALVECVRPWTALFGPTTAAELGAWMGVDPQDALIALTRVELSGNVMRGRFTQGASREEVEWCDRVLLARIHRRTVDGLRRQIEPVSPADLMRFYLAWQHVAPGSQVAGREGLARVIGQLQGFEVAAGGWESHVLGARVRGYSPGWLDELCFAGEVSWGRLSERKAQSGPTRATPIALVLRRDLPWLLAARARAPDAAEGGAALGPTAQAVIEVLRARGASFFDELVQRTKEHPAEVEAALWQLVAAGRVTGDGFSGMRALIDRAAREAVWHIGAFRGPAPLVVAGRWSELWSDAEPMDDAALLEALATQYLRRWGVVLRETLSREPHAPAWRELVRVYRRLELRGEIRGGRFVSGFVGEQFALPEAVDALRAMRRQPGRGEVVRVAACDPLNLTGALSPGARVPAVPGQTVAYRDGVPVDERPAEVPSGLPLSGMAG
jgi:ATP-dependent Lhr-like helicase